MSESAEQQMRKHAARLNLDTTHDEVLPEGLAVEDQYGYRWVPTYESFTRPTGLDADTAAAMGAEATRVGAMIETAARQAGWVPGDSDPIRVLWTHPDVVDSLAQAHYEAHAENEYRQVHGAAPSVPLAVDVYYAGWAVDVENGQRFGWDHLDPAHLDPAQQDGRPVEAPTVVEARNARNAETTAGHLRAMGLSGGPAAEADLPDRGEGPEHLRWVADWAAETAGWETAPPSLEPDPLGPVHGPTHSGDPQIAEVLHRFADEHPGADPAQMYDLQVYTPTAPEGVYEDDWTHDLTDAHEDTL